MLTQLYGICTIKNYTAYATELADPAELAVVGCVRTIQMVRVAVYGWGRYCTVRMVHNFQQMVQSTNDMELAAINFCMDLI
jgi:hypothetical protein